MNEETLDWYYTINIFSGKVHIYHSEYAVEEFLNGFDKYDRENFTEPRKFNI